MANNAGGGSFTILDNSRESSSFGFATGALTPVSLPGALTAFGTLRTKTAAIVKGTIAAEALIVNRTKLSNTPPVDPTSDVGRKLLVTYEDTTEYFDDPVNAIPNAGFGKVFSVEIPDFDDTLAGVMIANTDDVNMGQAAIGEWITAFEALAKSPYNGAVHVTRMQRVQR